MSHAASLAAVVGAREVTHAAQLLRERLQSDPLDFQERLAALAALSDAILSRRIDPRLTTAGGAFLAAFLQPRRLERLIARELQPLEALDRFSLIEPRKSIRFAPRGIVCHWIAGNVPLLGMLSWTISALVGNANIVRLSTRQEDFVSPLLAELASLSGTGRALVERTAIASIEREDRDAQEAMSLAADVRIAWGGQEAVDTIVGLRHAWHCETVVFGPRASLAVIDPAEATDRLLDRLVSDITYFDQLACSSPQIVFVKGSPQDAGFATFLERFQELFAARARAIPRHALDFDETYRIELDRARVLLEAGRIWRDQETQWTVAMLPEPHPRVTCANRFVQVVPFSDAAAICAHIPQNVQTVVTLLRQDDLSDFTERATWHGVCRFPRPGEGNNFESPWDGIPLASRLVRWIVRTDAPVDRTHASGVRTESGDQA